MTVPKTASYEILDARPAKTGSSVVLSMRDTETQELVSPVYANPSRLRLPVVVGKIGKATFEHKQSQNPKPNDKGYLVLDVWCEVGGTPPHPNPTGGQPSPKVPRVKPDAPRDPNISLSVSVSRKKNLGNFESADVFLTVSGITSETTPEDIEVLLDDQGELAFDAIAARLKEKIEALN